VLAVAARARRIVQRARGLHRHRHHVRAHRPRRSRDLVHRLALHPQRDEIRADLRLCGITRHDVHHRRFGFSLR
jgi:hypothetical protein